MAYESRSVLGAIPIGHAVCIQLVVSRFGLYTLVPRLTHMYRPESVGKRLLVGRSVQGFQMIVYHYKCQSLRWRVTFLAGLSLQANYCSVSHPLQQQTKLSLISKWTINEHNGRLCADTINRIAE